MNAKRGGSISDAVGEQNAASSSAEFNPWRIEAMPAGLIEEPLEFIFAEHHRQRQAAQILSMIAEGEFDRIGVKELVDFLEKDFAQHIADEELAFFPVLKVRCIPEDDIDALIARLAEEHKQDESLADEVIVLIKKLLNGAPLNTQNRARIRNFGEHVHQHIALENAVLLPIARVRLDEASQAALSQMLKERRVAARLSRMRRD